MSHPVCLWSPKSVAFPCLHVRNLVCEEFPCCCSLSASWGLVCVSVQWQTTSKVKHISEGVFFFFLTGLLEFSFDGHPSSKSKNSSLCTFTTRKEVRCHLNCCLATCVLWNVLCVVCLVAWCVFSRSHRLVCFIVAICGTSVRSTWFHWLLCCTLPCILAENTFSLVAVIVMLLTCFSECSVCNFCYS